MTFDEIREYTTLLETLGNAPKLTGYLKILLAEVDMLQADIRIRSKLQQRTDAEVERLRADLVVPVSCGRWDCTCCRYLHFQQPDVQAQFIRATRAEAEVERQSVRLSLAEKVVEDATWAVCDYGNCGKPSLCYNCEAKQAAINYQAEYGKGS